VNIKSEFFHLLFVSAILMASFFIISAQALSPLWISGLAESDQNITDVVDTGSHFLNYLAISDGGKTIAAGTYDGNMYLVNETGAVLWNRTTSSDTRYLHSLLLSPDGNYLAVSDSGSVPASNPKKSIRLIHKSGETLWNNPARTFVFYSAISSNGSCTVFGSYDDITCFDKTGSSLWTYPVNDRITSLDMSEDGKSTVAVLDHSSVLCLNMRGEEVWKHEFRDVNDMKMSGDGNYVCLISSKTLYCLNREGTTLWKRALAEDGIMLEVSETGNTIVVRTPERAFSYDLSGNKVWEYRSEYPGSSIHPLSPPLMALSGDGLYTAFISGQSLLLLNQTGISSGNFSSEEPLSGVAISSDGEDVVAITKKDLYFFKNPAYVPDSSVTTNARQNATGQPLIGEKVPYQGTESVFSVFYKSALLPYVIGALFLVATGAAYYLLRWYRRNGAQ
jgi:outer membrane protein assembly factor BamB